MSVHSLTLHMLALSILCLQLHYNTVYSEESTDCLAFTIIIFGSEVNQKLQTTMLLPSSTLHCDKF